MTPAEFKAWFEGFCEAIDGAPTEEQFAKIREKVSELSSVEYVPPHWPSKPWEPQKDVSPFEPTVIWTDPGTAPAPRYEPMDTYTPSRGNVWITHGANGGVQ